ncbi:MAG: PRC-barrel domain-containing protein [Hyphomonas sp.]|jgi:sporulation protein YlmC with PRC-barrel domain|nr:PRC-barrel domain-containing protein [Hyphomonas sp.]
MKSLLATVSALALLGSAAACDSANKADYDTPQVIAENPSTIDDTTTRAADAREVYRLASGEYEASDLIGASVHNTAGDEIAVVSDIWLSDNGSAPMLVVRDGGIAGVGGDLRTVAFNAATITPDASTSGDEPDVIVRYTGDTLSTLPKFEQASMDDYRLASEMLGTNVALTFNGETGRINDLILSNTGEARYAVIAADLVGTNQFVVDADAITLAQGDTDGEFVLDLSADAFAKAPEYPRE